MNYLSREDVLFIFGVACLAWAVLMTLATFTSWKMNTKKENCRMLVLNAALFILGVLCWMGGFNYA